MRKAACASALLLLVGITAVRLFSIYRDYRPIDFRLFTDLSTSVVRGVDPYDVENYEITRADHAHIALPAYALFFAPVVYSKQDNPAALVYLTLNIVIAFATMWWLLKSVGLVSWKRLRRLDRDALVAATLIAWFLCSMPVKELLSVGNVSLIHGFCILLLFTSAGGLWSKASLLGTAALKYNLVPLLAITLFVKRNFRLCLLSFCFFVALGATPLLWGNELGHLYSNYLRALVEGMTVGINESHTNSQVQLFFFQSTFLNHAAKLSVFVVFLVSLWRERKTTALGLNHLLFIQCATMSIVYHRTYDLVLVLPLLLIVTHDLYAQRRLVQTVASAGFCIFFLIPPSWLLRGSSRLGSALPWHEVLVFADDKTLHLAHIFPLTAMVMTLLTFFSAYLCLFTDETTRFELRSGSVIRAGWRRQS